MLQAYQVDLLRDLDQSPEGVSELALLSTKQTVAAIGQSMLPMVATERHL